MNEPTPRTSRLALAGGIAAVIAIGGTGFLLGRKTAEPPAPPRTVVVAAPTPAPSPSPDVPEGLDRAGLLALAAAAADAAAQGGKPGAVVTRAIGRRFSIVLPFGCSGQLADDDRTSTGWRYDPDTKALRVQVASNAWTPADWWPDPSPGDVEAIEGFWISRPWSTSEACPPAATAPAASDAEPVTLPGQTLALGQVFREGGARQGRRDAAPYVAVVRVEPDAVRAAAGFRVRLAGQIAALPDGSAVRCRQPGGAEQRPICLVGATFEDVVIENPTTGETLAHWSGADTHRAL